MRERSILPKDTQDEAGGTQAQATFYATGFFPTSIPLAPLLNVALFWFPFASPSPRGGMTHWPLLNTTYVLK